MCRFQHLLLLLGVILCGHQHLAEINLIQLINDLNKQLHVDWNMFVVSSPWMDSKEVIDVLKAVEKSIVLKTNQEETAGNEKYIYELFTHNLLTIIFYKPKDTGVYATLELTNEFKKLAETLKMLHLTAILWIVDAEKECTTYIQTLSELCWNYGFVGVLFYHNNNLFTYTPLPLVKVLRLSSIEQFRGQQQRIANYHQYPIRFPITPSPPRCYRYTDVQGNVIYVGYFYEILMIFIRQYNFKFIEYPNDYNSDRKDKLLEDLALNKTDVVAFLAYRNRSLCASDVLWNVNAVILVPNANPVPKYEYFLKPFKPIIWILHILLVLFVSKVVSVTSYLKTNKYNLTKSFAYVLSLTIYQNQFQFFKNCCYLNGVIYTLVFLYGFIIVQMYLCKLSSMLVLTIYEPQITSLLDISSTTFQMFISMEELDHFNSFSAIPPVLLERLIITDGIDLDNKRRSLNTSFLHLGFEDKILFFLKQQKFLKVPLVRLIDPVVLAEPIFFTLRHNLPYMELFNRYLKYLAASGLLQKIFNDIESQGIVSGEIRYKKDPENDGDHLLTLEYFYSPLVLYLFGVILSVNVFIFEIVYCKLRVRLLNLN